ncbi:ABC transporter substrate-binding protein [Parafrankia sp. FMc2]|uniref:ABC transporter substrate-binding protein n=1 Tax=Parafrankia sp. FMc2 TaxID=3233196 RepID=UPI0034D79155
MRLLGAPPTGGRLRVALTASLAAVALVTAACGGDDDGSGGDRTADTGADAAILGTAKAATGTPVKIGWVSTGQTQTVDTTDEIKAAQATVAYANAYLGGLRGHPIELVPCEDKSVPATAQACGNTFVQEGVAAVAAGSPGQTDPWIKIVQPAGIPVGMSLAPGSVVLNTPGVFVWGNPLASFGTSAAYARAHKLTKAAVLAIDVPAASGPAKELEPIFFRNIGATVEVIAIPPGTADMTPQIQAAKNPDLFHIIGDPTFCVSAIRAIRTIAPKASITAVDRCIGTDKGASIPGGYEGVTIVAQANVDPNGNEFKLFKAVIEKYGDGLSTDGNVVSGYQGMLGFIRAVNAGGGTDVTPAGITKAIQSMPATPYPLGGGATFKCDGTAITGISKNICSTVGFVADAAPDGALSNFKTLDATGIYKLG